MDQSERAVNASQIVSNLAYAAMVGMVCIVLYRQNKTLIDDQVREWRYRLEELAAKRPWPTSRLWQDVREAVDGESSESQP